jgi:hypothetical protein
LKRIAGEPSVALQPPGFCSGVFVKNIQWFGGALLLAQAAASPAMAQSSVIDPAAIVPPVVYQSVFIDGPKGVATTSVDWKKANAEVGQFRRGHVDILKWEESQTTPSSRQAPSTLAPVLPPNPAKVAP